MQLAEIVDVLEVSAGPSKRARVVDEVARLLSRVPTHQLDLVVALLSTGFPAELSSTSGHFSAPIVPASAPTLTVDDLSGAILAIGESTSGARRHEIVTGLLALATHQEQLLIQVAAGARPGPRVDEPLMISAISRASRSRVRDVRRAVVLTSSLVEAARAALLDDGETLGQVQVEVGRPVRSMRCVDGDDFDRAISPDGSVIIEWDLAGERIQAHRSDRTVWLFGADGRDVTGSLPGLVPVIAALPGGDLILDGVVPAEPSRVGGDRVLFFDVLFDGESLLDRPLAERRALLASVVPAQFSLPYVTTRVRAVALGFVFDGVDRGHRRVVVKAADGVYEPDAAADSWCRVAPRFEANLVAIGAERGVGSRLGLFATVDFGARVRGGQFVRVARVARGMSTAMLEWQTERFSHLAIGDDSAERRAVDVRPSLVARVAYEGVDRSSEPGSMLLRSPRIVGYREDLGIDAVDSVEDVIGRRHEGGTPTSTHSDDPPRLPPSLPMAIRSSTEPAGNGEGSTAAPTVGDAGGEGLAGMTAAAVLDDSDPYVAPTLDERSMPSRWVLTTRIAMLVWAVALTATVAVRTNGDPDGTLLAIDWSWVGSFVAVSMLAAGAAWTDQRIRNLHLLGGRSPTRLRSITAWTAPVLGIAVLDLTVAPLDPTPGVDVRPIVLTASFAFVMWRPYALVRRLLAVLVRVRSDSLLASAYLVDLVAVGLLWRGGGFGPDLVGPLTPSGADEQVGVLVAAAIALTISVPLWQGIIRTLDSAQAHRFVAQRTRHEHRMLRLRNIDPTDPEVWWMLVRRRREEQRRLEEVSRPDATAGGVPSPTMSASEVDALVEDVRRQNRSALRQLDRHDADDLLRRLRAEYSSLGSDRPADARDPSPGVLPSPSGPRLERDPIRLRSSASTGKPDSMAALLREAGTVEIGAALAERGSDRSTSENRRTQPPRLYTLDLLRLVITVLYSAMALLAGLAFYGLVTGQSVGADGASTDLVGDLERGALVFIGLFVVVGAVAPAWAFAVLRVARRSGYDGSDRRWTPWLAVVGAAAACGWGAAQFAGAGGLATASAGTSVAVATMAIAMIEPLWVWLGLKPRSLVAWVGINPAIALIVLAGGAVTGIEEPISTLRFVVLSVLLALCCALATVFSTLATVDVGDELRSSRSLAVPSSSGRRSS